MPRPPEGSTEPVSPHLISQRLNEHWHQPSGKRWRTPPSRCLVQPCSSERSPRWCPARTWPFPVWLSAPFLASPPVTSNRFWWAFRFFKNVIKYAMKLKNIFIIYCLLIVHLTVLFYTIHKKQKTGRKLIYWEKGKINNLKITSAMILLTNTAKRDCKIGFQRLLLCRNIN